MPDVATHVEKPLRCSVFTGYGMQPPTSGRKVLFAFQVQKHLYLVRKY